MEIDALSKDQEARLAEYRDRWIKIGLSTKLANRGEAEEGLKHAYMVAGLNAPHIVWCASPLSNALTRATVFDLEKTKPGASVGDSVWDSVGDSVGASVRASVGASVGDSVGASVWDSVQDSVWDSVGDSVRASVRASVGDSVWDSVGDSVRASVWDSVGDSVRASVWDSVGDSVGASVWDSGYGQHDANWLAFYEYFHDVCRLHSETEKLHGLWVVAKNAGWFLPHKNICWVSERHTTLNLNEQGRPHCIDGLAIGYPDGWGVYALNGVRMEGWHVLTSIEKLDPRKILEVKNVEQRKELVRRMGIERFIQGCGAKSLEKKAAQELPFVVPAIYRDVYDFYELLDVSLGPEIPHARFLKMWNPSIGAWHVEGVAPQCQTVQQAHNWRAGNIEQEWKPAILT